MFRKAFKVKSNSHLKASDKKKLLAEVSSQFIHLRDEDMNLIFPTKEAISAIKIITSAGKMVTVYSVQKCPVVFEVEQMLFPTIYILWRVPHLVHIFTTVDLVAQKVIDGADLMLPGVVFENENSIECYGKIQKGDRVAVNTVGNIAAFAVGRAAASSQALYESKKRGKCVEILHSYNDKLWSLETTQKIPQLGPSVVLNENLRIVEDDLKSNCALEDVPSTLNTSVEDNEVSLSKLSISDGETIKHDSDESCAEADAVREMDELLMECFLKCLITSAKNVTLPVLANLFYKLHVLEASPPGTVLDVKKTKYRKFSKFLTDLASLGLVTLESFTKGVLSITNINFKHEFVENFRRLHPQQNVTKNVFKKASGPDISEKYVVNASVLPLFSKFMYKKGDSIPATDIRRVVTTYVKNENLQVEDCKGKVTVNPILSSILNTKEQAITWDRLMNEIIQKMGQCYQVVLGGNEVINAKGKLRPIELIVATRSGSKKVTLVNNLENYGVNIQEFSRQCQHGVAASTTTNILPGVKSVQVQIQGNQTIFISKLLTEKYMIPKRYIRGFDDGSKGKQK